MNLVQLRILLLIALLNSFAYSLFRQITPLQTKEEGSKSFMEMVQTHGYPVWSKFIDTPDGYILNIYRIPGKRNESLSEALRQSQNREPILMVHGLLSTSENFIMNGPELAPAYQLADTGLYDVWFLNVRGNSYSKQHNFYDADSSLDFWQFSFEEFGDFDIPTTVQYILQSTNKEKLSLLAFSQGTSSCFHSLAMNKQFYEGKIKSFMALAPVITLKFAKESLLKTLADMDYLGSLLNRYGYIEAFPTASSTEESAFLVGSLCEFIPSICTATIDVFSDTNPDLINIDRISVYTQQFVDSSSLKNLLHMSQIMRSGVFQLYDYGYAVNMDKYGTSNPPEIDISVIDIPIGLFIGKYDTLATPLDNAANKAKIQNLIHYQEYELDHLSFILAKDMSYFGDVLATLSKVYSE